MSDQNNKNSKPGLRRRRGRPRSVAVPAEPVVTAAPVEAAPASEAPKRRGRSPQKAQPAPQAAPKAPARQAAKKPLEPPKKKPVPVPAPAPEAPVKPGRQKPSLPRRRRAGKGLPPLPAVPVTPVNPSGCGFQMADRMPTQADRADGRPRLRVIPLGGMNEIGKNLTVFEYGSDIIIVDCGMTFPDNELPGVDLVIPDITYLVRNRDRVRGIFLTHAHEDHIGALPYVLRELNVPIYCTALTAGLVNLRLREHTDLKKVKIYVRKPGDRVRIGCFEVEFIHVNHSIADACALAIQTPVGLCVVTGDFKIDSTPIAGGMIDLERFGQLGRQGVLLLMMDSTNAERPGMAMSERKVGASLDREFKGCDKRIIVASFASNVYRIQEIMEVAARYGRKVAVSGRSMENILKVGMELGYLHPEEGMLIELNDIHRYPDDQLVIITTGSQGEPMSALYRMAFSGHRQVEVSPRDKILIAASPIPGNEKSVYTMINELMRKGAEVVYERLADIHVSGHACQEELKIMLSLIHPRFFLPAHGEYRHLLRNGCLGRDCGVPEDHIFISDLGRVLELDGETARFNGSVPSGRVLVDGYGVGNVGNAVLRERHDLSECGVIAAVAGIDTKQRVITSGPEIVSRGFVYVREAEELMEELRSLTYDTLMNCLQQGMTRTAIREALSKRLSDHLYKKTHLEPVILPVLLEL